MYLVPDAHVTPSLKLVRPLREGGVGRVWVCLKLPEGEEVAVKFLSDELLRGFPDVIKRFKREAEAALKLDHPHVVRTLDWGTAQEGEPYIVMELLAGESLGERLVRAGPLHPMDVARVVRQVASALDFAHGEGLVHRDIKPDNIFMVERRGPDRTPYVKVLDFGTIKHRERSDSLVTSTGVVVGTPEYMSPEQVLGSRDVDHRSDLWSLGVAAYHALTGRLPFEGDSPNMMVIDICNARFTKPSEVDRSLPAGLDEWFERALSRTPAGRFDSADELQRTFTALVGLPAEVVDDETTLLDAPATGDELATHPFRPALISDLSESGMKVTLPRNARSAPSGMAPESAPAPSGPWPLPPPSAPSSAVSPPALEEESEVDDGAATLALDTADQSALARDLMTERARQRRRWTAPVLVALVAAAVAVVTVSVAVALLLTRG